LLLPIEAPNLPSWPNPLAHIRALTSSVHPNPSWLGIGPAAVTAATTPILAGNKRRTGKRLHAA
jgi:hypothetical protein